MLLLKKLHLRRLRVQVLLWTILPVFIFLIAFSLTGSGSHEQSMRTLAADENLRLVGAISAAITYRLNHYKDHLELLAAAPDSYPTLQEMEVWRVYDDKPAVKPLPGWVTTAVEQMRRQPLAGGASTVMFNADADRVVWAFPLQGQKGWLVGGVPVAALDLGEQLTLPHPNIVTTAALVDAAGHIIFGSGHLPAPGTLSAWPGVTEGISGQRGVLVDSTNGREDITAYAPIAGTNWAVVLREPLDELTAPLFHFANLLPLIIVAGTLLSFFTLYFGLRYIARPLQKLAEQATRIGHGDYDAAATSVGGLDEIEMLRLTVNAMAHRIQASQTGMQEYVHAVTSVQEEERARLARELHDETVQTLIALDHKAQMAQRDFDTNPERSRAQIADLRHMLGSATQEVRRFSQALRPLYLDDLGLSAALEMLAAEAGAEFRSGGEQRRLAEDKELALYRIAQEALNNARRHAHATHTRMLLQFGAKVVTLAVSDDGKGFAVPEKLTDLTQAGHFGLMGMRERTDLIKGRLQVQSGSGKGTVIIVQAAADEGGRSDEEEWRTDSIAGWLRADVTSPALGETAHPR